MDMCILKDDLVRPHNKSEIPLLPFNLLAGQRLKQDFR
jgi:hypothetical protein